MMRRCDGKDPNLLAADGKSPCDCGSVFDDVRWMVIYPHRAVHGQGQLRPSPVHKGEGDKRTNR